MSGRGIARTDDPTATGPVHIAGHVNAILASGADGVLAGSHSGGVWQLTPNPMAPQVVAAFPLSNDWDNPDILCLATGPDGPDHAYAGCRSLTETLQTSYTGMPVLYEAPPGAPMSWSPIMDGTEYGSVYGVGVVANGRRLVAATTTGVWWSLIPDRAATGAARLYKWQAARWPGKVSDNPAVGCTGLAIAGDSVVASAAGGGTIWRGVFDAANVLVMSLAFAGVPDAARSSLAVCAGDQSALWCVIAKASNATLGAVARSTDFGQSWQIVTGHVDDGALSGALGDRAGNQGSYNNCIAVSPVHAATVLIGWQNGVFVSSDGGQRYIRWSGDRLHLHRDIHAVYFDPRDATGQTIFVGSDGGVTRTGDFGVTLDSAWNQNLANLQIGSVPCHNGYGTMSVHPALAGRVGAGLQDNGVAWCFGEVWRDIDTGDGAAAIFTSDAKLATGTISIEGAKLFRYSGTAYDSAITPPYFHPDGSLVTRVDSNGNTISAGLPNPVMEAVVKPGRAGPPVYVLGADGPADEPNSVFGLRYAKPDGSDAKWDRLASLPAGTAVWSLAALDEATIYAGTFPAHVYRLDLSEAGWRATELTGLPTLYPGQADPNATITRLVPLPDGSLLAVYNDSAYSGGASAGQIVHYTPATMAWKAITGAGTGLDHEPIFGLDADGWGVLYAATDDRILVATGPGGMWHEMSSGLPRRAHLGHLRFMSYTDGGFDLVLATWGRSMWKASWHPASEPWAPGRAAGPGLTYNRLVGSLVDGRLFVIGPGGLTPVGPIDPVLEQAALRSGAALDIRARELSTALTTPSAAAGGGAADALGRISALNNQLQRGLATLRSVSVGTQHLDAALLITYTTTGTAMVSQAVTAMTAQAAKGLPDILDIAVRALTAAAAEHAQLIGRIERAVGVHG